MLLKVFENAEINCYNTSTILIFKYLRLFIFREESILKMYSLQKDSYIGIIMQVRGFCLK